MTERKPCDVNGCNSWVKNVTKHKNLVHSDPVECGQCRSLVKDVTKHVQQKHRERTRCHCGKWVKDMTRHQKEHYKGRTVCCGKSVKDLGAHLKTDLHKRMAETKLQRTRSPKRCQLTYSAPAVRCQPCAEVNQDDDSMPEESQEPASAMVIDVERLPDVAVIDQIFEIRAGRSYTGRRDSKMGQRVSVGRRELDILLSDNEKLNDALIRLGMLHHLHELDPDSQCFGVDTLLTLDYYRKSMFERHRFILNPIHESEHWYLSIILLEHDRICPRWRIFVLDSLGARRDHSVRKIEAVLSRHFPNGKTVETNHLEVPKQKESDNSCGVFVLSYIEKFLTNPIAFLRGRSDWEISVPKWTKAMLEHPIFKALKEQSCHQPSGRLERWCVGDDAQPNARRNTDTHEDAHEDAWASEDSIPTVPPWKRILWIAFPDNPLPWNVRNSKSLAIEISNDHRQLPGLKWLNDNDLECLDRGLGQFYSRGRKDITLHQGLATMLIARPLSSVPIELHPWRWLEKQLKDPRSLHCSVIILHCTTSKPNNLFEICRRIESLSKQFSIRCVPTESELRQDQEKLDWMILDEIASRSAKFNFRPKTCPGKGLCLLSDERFTFMKRDHSSGGLHTTLQVNPNRGFLQCDIPGKRMEKTNDPDGCHWVHQQYIGSLRSKETLVSSVMEQNSSGGLLCKIVSKTVTTRDAGGNIISRGPVASDEGNLDTFVQDTIDALKAHPRFMELFQSLQVAGRLDIGFSSGEPWVNEISRWFNAHFFSLASLPEPYTQMVEALAISLLTYLGLLKHGKEV